jgi:hypothetical protein
MKTPTRSAARQLAMPMGLGTGVGAGIGVMTAGAASHGTGVEVALGPAIPGDSIEPHAVRSTESTTTIRTGQSLRPAGQRCA